MKYLQLVSLSFLILIFQSCYTGRIRSYSPETYFEVDSLRSINDIEIQKAFEAKPQLILPANVAFYNVGYRDDRFVDSLSALEQINKVFDISPALFNQQFYYKRRRYPNSHNIQPAPINMKQLRLLSAQAKADLLILCAITMNIDEKANSLVWSYFLLFPVFFVPAFDVNVTLEADLLFVDVRNGLLYHVTNIREEKEQKKIHPFKTNKQADKLSKEVIDELIPKITAITKEILSDAKNFVNTKAK